MVGATRPEESKVGDAPVSSPRAAAAPVSPKLESLSRSQVKVSGSHAESLAMVGLKEYDKEGELIRDLKQQDISVQCLHEIILTAAFFRSRQGKCSRQ